MRKLRRAGPSAAISPTASMIVTTTRRRPVASVGLSSAAEINMRGDNRAKRDAHCELSQRTSENAEEQTLRTGAEREADANLACPLRHGERHQRVHACSRQQQDAERQQPDGPRDVLPQRHDLDVVIRQPQRVAHLQRRIDLGADLSNAGGKTGGHLRVESHRQKGRVDLPWSGWVIHDGGCIEIEGMRKARKIPDDSDDLEPRDLLQRPSSNFWSWNLTPSAGPSPDSHCANV